ncbi:MAG: DUF115 domain-containing protein [Firmicutes bacterium]|nr:DUF115 domain-containing protein [Bacillota bacterium]
MQYEIYEYFLHPNFTFRKIVSKLFCLLARYSTIASDLIEPSKWINKADKKLLEKNNVLKHKYKNQRCFILATGPSLNKVDLDLLNGEVTIGVNSIWQHYDFTKWEPEVICYVHPIETEYQKSDSWKKYFSEFQLISKKSTLLTRLREKKIIETQQLFPLDRTKFISFGKELHRVRNVNFDLTRNIPSSKTVGVTAIITAVYMGCNPIYLLGFDHDWLTQRGSTTHFFKKEDALIEEEVGSTIHGDYDFYCREAVTVWKAYKVLKKALDKMGIEILNASPDSFLDVFPVINYNDIFKK